MRVIIASKICIITLTLWLNRAECGVQVAGDPAGIGSGERAGVARELRCESLQVVAPLRPALLRGRIAQGSSFAHPPPSFSRRALFLPLYNPTINGNIWQALCLCIGRCTTTGSCSRARARIGGTRDSYWPPRSPPSAAPSPNSPHSDSPCAPNKRIATPLPLLFTTFLFPAAHEKMNFTLIQQAFLAKTSHYWTQGVPIWMIRSNHLKIYDEGTFWTSGFFGRWPKPLQDQNFFS